MINCCWKQIPLELSMNTDSIKVKLKTVSFRRLGGGQAHVDTWEIGTWLCLCFSVLLGLALPHFSGLHALSTVVPHVHKGHLADAPWLCNPYVLAAVTVARDDLIHLKHTWFSMTSPHGTPWGEWEHFISQLSWYSCLATLKPFLYCSLF